MTEEKNNLATRIEEDSFAKRLNPVTSRYLASQTKQFSETQSLDKIDLRHMCDQVVQELQNLENEAAFDYLKVENDAIELSKQIDQSDSILGELETILLSFQDHLGNIKNEMTFLQEKSLNMNISLNNRRNLQKSLEKLIDSILLEPQLIYDICNKNIDENYVGYIKELNEKLDYIKNNNLEGYSTVKELEPELNKLKNKACQRVRTFILQQLERLKKPMTNIPIIQENELLRYSVFMEFLKNNYIQVFIEILNMYFELMGKIIFKKFKAYVQEVSKLCVDVYNKNDILISENIQVLRGNLTVKAEGMIPDNRSIFSTMKRETILENAEDSYIIPHTAIQMNHKFLLESIFRSVNKLLVDTVTSEYKFVTEFFTLKPDKSKQVFGKIFEETFDFLIEFFKGMFANTNDVYSVLLISQLNAENQRVFESKGFVILDHYFTQISQSLWPSFDRLFEVQVNSIKSISVKGYKNVEKVFGTKALLMRLTDFALSLYKINKKGNENYMVRMRISQLKNLIIDLLRKSAKDIPNEMESTIYFITGLDFVHTDFTTHNSVVFEEDLRSLEKELNHNIEKMVELSLSENFQSLVDFVKKYGGDEIKKLGNSESMAEALMETEKAISTNKGEVNQTLIKNINVEFKEQWNRRVETFKEKCAKSFGTGNTFKLIVTGMLNSLLAYYGFFFEYVKQNYSSFVSSMLPLHALMKDIQNHKKKVA